METEINRRQFVAMLGAGAFLATAPGMSFARVPAKDLTKEGWAQLPKEKPVRGGTLRMASSQYIGMMNPNHWPVNDWVAMGAFLDKFILTDGEYRPSVPWLAESIQAESPTSVIMTLRRGIKFHDGTAFNAETVKFQADWTTKEGATAWSKSWLAPLESVEVLDEYRLRWKFKTTWGAFQGLMANVPGYALSAQQLADGRKFDTEPKGTGPWIVVEGKQDSFLRMKRNPDWWLAKLTGSGAPYFDELLISVVPDPAVRLANLRAGRIDMLTVDKSQYAIVKRDANLQVYVTPVPTVTGLRMNSKSGPCADVRVRDAINRAINREALIHGTQHGLGRIASGLYPNDHFASNKSLKPIGHDPERAKRLLKEAGFDDGLKLRGYFGNLAADQTLAQAIKHMLLQVGIEWEVEMLTPAARTERLDKEEFDLALGGWNYIYDPDLAMSGLYHPTGRFAKGRVQDDERTRMIEEARNEPDPQRREKLYQVLDKYVTERYLDVWLWWEQAATAYGKHIRGYDHDAAVKYKEAYTRSYTTYFDDGGAHQR